MSVQLHRDKDGRLTPAPPSGELIDSPPFPVAAKRELANVEQRKNLRHATHTIREKRARVVNEVANWEDLRAAGGAIKNKVLRHLPDYLEQLEQTLTANGATVHWARNGDEANKIVIDLVKATQAPEVVKAKSMLTEEIDLNEALEKANIAAWETDLAQIIVQLGHDRPSHILVPAIHRNRSEVREIFLEEMGIYGKPAPKDLDSEPTHLTAAARSHLREKFLRSTVGISGGNFAIAETGQLVVVESEGNARMSLTLPQTLISVVGIEKILPKYEDLEIFMQLLPRSSTAERMNPYSSVWSGVTDGDGPQNVHVVLVDNGRTNVLKDPKGRDALRCIRCSACLNVCPVYEKVGGHAYGSVYPGPIGAILNPQLRGTASAVDRSLPYASSLCHACQDVCPVEIPIADLLVHMRHKVVEAEKADQANSRLPKRPIAEPILMGANGWLMGDSKRLQTAQWTAKIGRRVLGVATDHVGPLPWPVSRWTNSRDVPLPPKQTFRDWWDNEHGKDA